MTPEQIAKECERRFQASGPRVYTYEPERGRLFPNALAARDAVRLAMTGDQVWARRKVRGVTRYEFVLVGTGD